MGLLEQFTAEFPRSARMAAQARTLFPAGVTHDLRYLTPFPLYIDRQLGSQKWDVDGHAFIDYWVGHGSMLLGHSHSSLVSAVQNQVERQTHVGGCHELEITWGEMVRSLVPCAEMVRFTGSGTEATLMAIRLCRMFTGRRKLLKFAGHFHGWHDAVQPGADPPYDTLRVPGVPESVGAETVVIPPNDVSALESVLAADPEIGCVILEPTGGHWGAVPIRGPFLHAVRELTSRFGQLLIFDEVITGFRVAPGGAQERHGIKPDLTTLAKILAGGLPGGCLAGRAEVLSAIDFRPGKPKMRHPGTYNANPLSAAAGIAALSLVKDGEPCRRANASGRTLRNGLNRMFRDTGRRWAAYIDYSMFRLVPNYDGPIPTDAAGDDDGMVPYDGDLNRLDGPADTKLRHAFRQAMLLNGVDMPGTGGWISAAHSEADLAKTITAVDRSIGILQQEGFAV